VPADGGTEGCSWAGASVGSACIVEIGSPAGSPAETSTLVGKGPVSVEGIGAGAGSEYNGSDAPVLIAVVEVGG
jgi:hypothetical protein